MCSISVEPMPSTMSTPKCALEAFADLGRQRLAGGGHQAQRDVASRRQVGSGQHAGEAGGRAVEHGRLARPPTPPSQRLKVGVGRRPLGHQQRRRADAHREAQRIAQAVGEEQLGRREADVGLAQAQHALAVQLGRPVGVGVRVHGALGAAGRARRIEPEAGVVGARSRRAWPAAGGPARRPRTRLRPGCSGATGRETMTLRHFVIGLDHRRRQRRQQCARHQHRLRARVLQHVGVVVGGQQRVHGHRHQAGVHRAEEAHRPVVAVVHQQQHALFAPDAQRAQAGGDAAHALVELRRS